MRADAHELEVLADDFDKAAATALPKVAKVTGMAMNKMKKDAQRAVSGHKHLPHLGRSFTYDVTTRGLKVIGEVGAEHARRQGKLDVFIENGTPTSAPIPHWGPAADKEIPAWERYLDQVAAEVTDAG